MKETKDNIIFIHRLQSLCEKSNYILECVKDESTSEVELSIHMKPDAPKYTPQVRFRECDSGLFEIGIRLCDGYLVSLSEASNVRLELSKSVSFAYKLVYLAKQFNFTVRDL